MFLVAAGSLVASMQVIILGMDQASLWHVTRKLPIIKRMSKSFKFDIFFSFSELSKTSVVHMCSLFHAFILCQLWTVYLEQIIVQHQYPGGSLAASGPAPPRGKFLFFSKI